MWCWGDNSYGRLGDNTTSAHKYPVQVAGGGSWSSVSTGYVDTCAIKTDQTLWCWGYNPDGEVGDNTTTERHVPTAVSVSGTTTWLSVEVGQYFACGVKTDHTLWCWGYGANGRLASGATTSLSVPTQVGSATWSAIGVGYQHGCAIKQSDSSLWCWGYNGHGQVGNNTTTDQDSPVAVTGGGAWISVGGGELHTCALKSNHSIWCWGYNPDGELGNNSTTDSAVPVQESTSSTTWTVLAVGGYTTCALTATSALDCWGYDALGQLGTGNTTAQKTPTASGSSTAWTQLAVGEQTVCGIQTDSGIWCQGDDAAGQQGSDNIEITSPTLLQPPGTSWISASSAWQDGCAIRSDGTMWCWGINAAGEDGNSTTAQNNFPVQAGSATTWASVSMSYQTTCAIRTDASLWCWGYGGRGQLGTVSTTDQHSPTAGPSGSWNTVSVGESHTCAIKTDQTLWCWGTNDQGQLGQGTTTTSNTPVQVTASGVTGWTSVSAGYQDTCAITTASALYCWGDNANGQIGQGSATPGNYPSPTQVGATTWTNIAVGYYDTCGVKASGTLWCWGDNVDGEIGQGGTAGTPANYTTPSQVGSATTWAQAGAGHQHSCAMKTDHTVWCWGYDQQAQLGDRATATQTSPQQVPGATGTTLNLHAWTDTTTVIGPVTIG